MKDEDKTKEQLIDELLQLRQRITELEKSETKRKEAAEALRDSDEKYRTLVENVNIGVYRNTAGPHGHFIQANPAIAKMFGYDSVDEFMKVRVSDLYQNSEERKLFVEEMLQKGFVKNKELCLRKKDGAPIWASCTAKVHYDTDGNIAWMDGVIEDISERKQVEDQLKVSLREKEMLLRELYHRTKNNMQVISSLLNLQSLTIDDKQMLEVVKDIQHRIRSISLVHEKLYQAKDLSNVNLKDYIQELTDALLTSYEGSKHRISLTLDIDNVFISLDSITTCGLIINELVSNSLKHAFPDNREGTIRIVLYLTDGDEMGLRISDNGIGLPQGLDFRDTKSLGLKLVRKLAEDQLGGKVELQDEKGTDFLIKFKETTRHEKLVMQ
jgi:PAS domain S-box-containing protein